MGGRSRRTMRVFLAITFCVSVALALPATVLNLQDQVTKVDTVTSAGPPVSTMTTTTTTDLDTGAVALTKTVDGKTSVDVKEGATIVSDDIPCVTTTTSSTQVTNELSPGKPPCNAEQSVKVLAQLEQASKVNPENQTGGDVKDTSTQVTNPSDVPQVKVDNVAIPTRDLPFNGVNETYPVSNDAKQSRKESSEYVAGHTVLDPEKQDVHGVSSEPVLMDRPEMHHPMEVLTPLVDNFPCDPDNILDVSVPDVVDGYLPTGYGCSDWNEYGREKPSPAISWSNVATDVIDFSLQIVDIGGQECNGKGDHVGKIHWHVENITMDYKVELPKGASKDVRLLKGGVEMPNSWLETYYSGPCPARGDTGCYRVKVLAHRKAGICQCGHFDFKFSRAEKPVEWVYKDKKIAPVGVAEIETPLDGFVDPATVKPDPQFKPGATIGLKGAAYDFIIASQVNDALVQKVFQYIASLPEKTIKAGFEKFDTNSNGKISTSELELMITTLFPKMEVMPTEKDLEAMVALVDTDGDGSVSLPEILTAALTAKNAKAVEATVVPNATDTNQTDVQ